jgi:GT2 family glycosyltransferase
MTVNPAARLYHLTSRTPGRHDHEEANSRLLTATSLSFLTPDWHMHLERDGLRLHLSEWQTLTPRHDEIGKGATDPALAALRASGDAALARAMLERAPFRPGVHEALASALRDRGDDSGARATLLSLAQMCALPDVLLALLSASRAASDQDAMSFAVNNLFPYCRSFESYLEGARRMRDWCGDIGLDDLAGQYAAWLLGADTFRRELFLPFLRRMRELTRLNGPCPLTNWAYCLWRELLDKRGRTSPPPDGEPPAFSVLMPVYDPRPEHLRAAVDSLLAQEWPHWELCLADDASPDPAVAPLLVELTALDSRIRATFRPANGGIAAATNTALGMARNSWATLMDQDDLLTPDALQEMAAAILRNPRGELFFSDEDKIADDGEIFYPHYKSWDGELLTGHNFVCHLGVYKTARLRALNGLRDGFSGSQDYDLLLRYVEGVPEAHCVHIPKILYHWRVHAGSTSLSLDIKPEALENGRAALEDWLKRRHPGAKAETLPQQRGYRARYPLPRPAPLVSLLLDVGAALPLALLWASAILEKTAYGKLELLVTHDAESAEDPALKKMKDWAASIRSGAARLLSLSSSLSGGARANAAARAARGGMFGWLGRGVLPLEKDWLEELVSRAALPEVDAVGGRLLDMNGRIHSLGLAADAEGRLFSLFRGLRGDDAGYFSQAGLARSMAALDARCCLTSRRAWEHAGGFDENAGAWFIDYCLRLPGRKVITPFASFACVIDDALPWEEDGPGGVFVREDALPAANRPAPWHPRLAAGEAGWTLHWPAGDDKPAA